MQVPQNDGDETVPTEIKVSDLIGHWTVLEVVKADSRGGPKVVECVCICGKIKNVYCRSLVKGVSRSCGCRRGEKRLERTGNPAVTNPREYYSYRNARNRCFRKKDQYFANYGGRGITMCDRWKYSFVAFLEDMGKRPEGHEIDRIDVNGNYEPSNCRWVTHAVNSRNKRSATWVEYNGKSVCLKELAELTGIGYGTIWKRVVKMEWPVEKAVRPVGHGARTAK